jgi:hypothetical protein
MKERLCGLASSVHGEAFRLPAPRAYQSTPGDKGVLLWPPDPPDDDIPDIIDATYKEADL